MLSTASESNERLQDIVTETFRNTKARYRI